MTTAAVPSVDSNRWPSSSDGVRAAALCAILSIALHGFLLSLRLPASSAAQNWQGTTIHDSGPRVRVVTLTPSAPPVAPWIDGRPAVHAQTHGQPVETPRSLPPVAQHKDLFSDKLPEKREAPRESHVEPVPLAMAPLTRSGNFGDDYVPRPLLTAPPVAITPVVFATPEGDAFRGTHVGILSLFIDEHGRVQRIEVDAAMLPEAFEQAVRDAFMAAQFTPGEIDGTAVRSRVRVEVIFDDTPIPER
jgi:hypothetical protein